MVENIEPKPGEIWAITGASESGHSDFLRRFMSRNSVWISYKHPFRNLSNTTELYYQQRFNSCDSEDSMTVSEYLDAASQGHDLPDRLVGHIRHVLQLEPLMGEQLIKLSNGETRKVLIAEAWTKQPEMLLLDHPLTGLDVASRSSFNGILKEIAASGRTILMASGPYDIPDAASHVVVMRSGEVVEVCERERFDPAKFNLVRDIVIDTDLLEILLANRNKTTFHKIISMSHVSISYDGRRILNDIDWEVLPGQRWALTGPNGAGKSTLLSLVMADNPQAYANDIILFDRKRGSGESIWDIKRETGFVSPEFYQYFPMEAQCIHVIESGFFDTVGLFRPSRPELEAICLQWMKLFHIETYGMRSFSMVPPDVQRLCLLARALVKNPSLLVLDEPTQGLDTSQQKFFVRLIDEICGLCEVTMIYVSHYREHIPSCVNRELKLENGGRIS